MSSVQPKTSPQLAQHASPTTTPSHVPSQPNAATACAQVNIPIESSSSEQALSLKHALLSITHVEQ